MTTPQADRLLPHVCQLLSAGRDGHIADRQLLETFAAQRDEAAFAALVRRHGPMVLRVCRRVLGDLHAADDAFQATFLVLAGKASSVGRGKSLGCWLYGVAWRLALKARLRSARRALQEAHAGLKPSDDPVADVSWREVRAVLDEELNRLPERSRFPLVLCYLEGQTRDEAAQQLGWSLATLKRRLEQGRELLRTRLARRGLELSAALVAVELTGDDLPAALVETVSASATAFASGKAAASVEAAALATRGLRDLAAAKLKVGLALLLAVGTIGTGAGLLVTTTPERTAPGLAVRAGQLPERSTAAQAGNTEAAPAAAPEPEVAPPPKEPPPPLPPAPRVLRHGSVISQVVSSPDGKTLVSVGDDRAIRLWGRASGKEVRRLSGPDHPVCVVISPDGKLLASGDRKDGVCLWDIATGKEVRRLSLSEKGYNSGGEWDQTIVGALRFSSDSKTLVTAKRNGVVHVWDVAQGKKLRFFSVCEAGVAFSDEGTTLIALVGEKGVGLWDVATGKQLHDVSSSERVAAVALSPDGRLLAYAGQDPVIRLVALTNGRVLRTLSGHRKKITAIAFSPDGRTLASTSLDLSVRLWEAASGQEVRSHLGHRLRPLTAAFVPDGRTLVTAGADGTVRLWEGTAWAESTRPVDLLCVEELEALWSDLASADAGKACRAIGRLRAASPEAVDFMSERLLSAVSPKQVAAWVADLGSDAFAVRQRATKELENLGDWADPALREALAAQPSLEVSRRIDQLLEKIKNQEPSPSVLRAIRAVQALELTGTPEARAALEQLAREGPGARLMQEAKMSLGRLAKRTSP
jgi:RNA polymerase sigma factor (sigma-70 family)